jgi:hypothetical protein
MSLAFGRQIPDEVTADDLEVLLNLRPTLKELSLMSDAVSAVLRERSIGDAGLFLEAFGHDYSIITG